MSASRPFDWVFKNAHPERGRPDDVEASLHLEIFGAPVKWRFTTFTTTGGSKEFDLAMRFTCRNCPISDEGLFHNNCANDELFVRSVYRGTFLAKPNSPASAASADQPLFIEFLTQGLSLLGDPLLVAMLVNHADRALQGLLGDSIALAFAHSRADFLVKWPNITRRYLSHNAAAMAAWRELP